MFRSYCHGLLALALAAQMTGSLWAQEGGAAAVAGAHAASGTHRFTGNRSGYRAFGFLSMLQQTVGLTPEQQDAVRGLLADQRQQVAALHEKTDSRIRAVLTADQQKKFDAFLAEQKSQRSAKNAQG